MSLCKVVRCTLLFAVCNLIHSPYPHPCTLFLLAQVRLFLYLKPQDNCPISWMSNDVLFYILNMCRHDWCAPAPQRVAELEAAKEEKKKAKAAAKAKAERSQLRARNAFLRSRGIEVPEGDDLGESSSNDDDDDEGGKGAGGGGSSSSSSMMVHARRAAAEDSSDSSDSDGGMGMGRGFGRPTSFGRSASTRGEAMRWMLRHFTGAGADDEDDDDHDEDDDDEYYQEIEEDEFEDDDEDEDEEEEDDEEDDDEELPSNGGTSSSGRRAWEKRVFGADSPSEESNGDERGAATGTSERMEETENGDQEGEEAEDEQSSSYEAPAKAYRRKHR